MDYQDTSFRVGKGKEWINGTLFITSPGNSQVSKARPGPPTHFSTAAFTRPIDTLVEHYGNFVGGEALGWVAGVAGAYRCFVVLAGGDFLLQDPGQMA